MSSIVRISDGRYVEMDVRCEPRVLAHLQRQQKDPHIVTTVSLHVRFIDFAALSNMTELGYCFFGQSACSPLDTYDREHGIKIAMRRAFDKDRNHTLTTEDRAKIVDGLFPGLIRTKNGARKALEAAR